MRCYRCGRPVVSLKPSREPEVARELIATRRVGDNIVPMHKECAKRHDAERPVTAQPFGVGVTTKYIEDPREP